MSMKDLEKAFEIIRQYKGNTYFEGEKSEELITKAETVLGFPFPPTYRQFVKQYGAGGFEGIEINGVIDDKFDYWCSTDSVGITLNERETSNAPLNFIVIGSSGFGPQYVLDASQKDKDGEYPVLLWAAGSPNNLTEKVANDFGEFLLEQVQNALEQNKEE